MEMDMDMMMNFHQELYRLHCSLANKHHEITQIEMQIANANYQMHRHMMNHQMQNQKYLYY